MTFLNQPGVYGAASFVAECLALFPSFVLCLFGLVSGIFQASAQMPPRGIYSDVTLPYQSTHLILPIALTEQLKSLVPVSQQICVE
jgi:hypothetical protein